MYDIILSAGLSGRIGKFIPLLNFKSKSFIQNITLKLNSVCDKIIIAAGYGLKNMDVLAIENHK